MSNFLLLAASLWESEVVAQLVQFLDSNKAIICVFIIPFIAKAVVPKAWDRKVDNFLSSKRWILWVVLGIIYLMLLPVLCFRATQP